MKFAKIFFPILSILLLLLAIPKGLFPYGYYNLLRLVVCGTGVFLAVIAYQQENIKWAWIMGVITFVFNPILPLYLGKEIWVLIDIITAIAFGVFLYDFKNKDIGER